MKIALDIDGVVANMDEQMQEETKKRGYDLCLNQYNPSVEGIDNTKEFIHDVVGCIFREKMFEIEPYHDAIWFIPLISIDLGPITFITARREEFLENTRVWLQHHFSISFDLVGKASKDKAQFLMNEKFDVLVEDRLRTANQCAEIGLKTYLINRDWNVGRETHKDVIRIEGLNQFYTWEMELVRNEQ